MRNAQIHIQRIPAAPLFGGPGDGRWLRSRPQRTPDTIKKHDPAPWPYKVDALGQAWLVCSSAGCGKTTPYLEMYLEIRGLMNQSRAPISMVFSAASGWGDDIGWLILLPKLLLFSKINNNKASYLPDACVSTSGNDDGRLIPEWARARAAVMSIGKAASAPSVCLSVCLSVCFKVDWTNVLKKAIPSHSFEPIDTDESAMSLFTSCRPARSAEQPLAAVAGVYLWGLLSYGWIPRLVA